MESTSEQVAIACKDVLSEEDCKDIAALDFEEAIGHAFTLLLENGIDDPEGYLKEKGVLE